MIREKKSHRTLLPTNLICHLFKLNSKKGFSLVELSVVLVIIGLILGAGITIWRSSIGSTRLSTTKANLDNIKSSVINFAVANGRLPCSDTTLPPNNTGVSNPPAAGACACVNAPCYVPFQTLQLQLSGGKDSFGNVFFYDVSYDTAGGALGGLTSTTQDTFCSVLFEYLSHATDVGVLRVPSVTNQNDAADNGQIGAVGQGYSVAAVAISQTSADNVFNATPGLSGKNIAGSPREYEMATRQNGPAYGDLVGELTYGELFNKVCTAQKTKIRIQNYTGAGITKYAQLAGTTACIVVNPQPAGFVDLYQGSTVTFFNDAACTTPCGGTPTPITFNMSSTSDAGTMDWNGVGIYGRDGRVQIISNNCTLSDNANANP